MWLARPAVVPGREYLAPGPLIDFGLDAVAIRTWLKQKVPLYGDDAMRRVIRHLDSHDS